MAWLLLVAAVWAASFSLIKTYLTTVHPDVVNAVRLVLALAVFLPFLRWRGAGARRALELAVIGAVQLGAMYAFYTRAFAYLAAHEAALATITTPLYVTLLDDALERRLRLDYLLCALLATAGTAVSLGVLGPGATAPGLGPARGLLLVQASNVCFAVGQLWFRRAMARAPGLTDVRAFAWCALGAAVVALAAAVPQLAARGVPVLGAAQWVVLVYLGVVASGLGFFLWNVGARQVNTGVLAVMNDLKIPLAMLVAVVIFRERGAWPRLVVGLVLVAVALWLAARVGRARATAPSAGAKREARPGR